MRAHEAGALHGDLGYRGPAWLRTPEDVNALVPQLWPRTVSRTEAGPLQIGGVSVAELSRAVKAGVGRIIVDSFDEISRLSEISEKSGKTPKVLIRVTVGVEAHTHEYIATAHEDQKFGFSLAGGAAFAAAVKILDE